MSGSMAKCQRVGCGTLTDDRRRRVAVATPYGMHQHPYATDAAQFVSWHPSNLAVDVVLCDACAIALGATETPKESE